MVNGIGTSDKCLGFHMLPWDYKSKFVYNQVFIDIQIITDYL